jgi:hypothetical protein
MILIPASGVSLARLFLQYKLPSSDGRAHDTGRCLEEGRREHPSITPTPPVGTSQGHLQIAGRRTPQLRLEAVV